MDLKCHCKMHEMLKLTFLLAALKRQLYVGDSDLGLLQSMLKESHSNVFLQHPKREHLHLLPKLLAADDSYALRIFLPFLLSLLKITFLLLYSYLVVLSILKRFSLKNNTFTIANVTHQD